jgi:hypothetical protein
MADPIIDLFKRVAGPAADEVGLTLQDAVHVYRAKRAYRLARQRRGVAVLEFPFVAVGALCPELLSRVSTSASIASVISVN